MGADSISESVNGATAVTIQDAAQFKKNAIGQQKRWTTELNAAEVDIKKFWRRADETVGKLIDKRAEDRPQRRAYRVNLFASNVQTQRAMLYGNEPEVVVDRRFMDANDDEARVAGEMLERILNTDLAYSSDPYYAAIGKALDDLLTIGMGNGRIVYEAEYETVPGKPAQMGPHPLTGEEVELAPAVPETEKVTSESCRTYYVSWRDQLWSISRTWEEVRWWAFRSYLSRDEVKKRFGEEMATKAGISYSRQKKNDALTEDALQKDPWERAEIWEIWSKEDKKVFWFCKGAKQILDEQDDPYGLEGFWPFPEPMMSNLTTSSLMPTSDYSLAQDLYDEYDVLSVRIRQLVKAVKVVGLYNGALGNAPKRLFNETFDNDVIGVEAWALMTETGGLQGNMQFLPQKEIVDALTQLVAYRDKLKADLDELTGMGDIIRGASMYVGSGPMTAEEAASRTHFASMREQARLDRFVRFCSELQALKGEIVCKHYSPETILNISNIKRTFNTPEQVQAALELLKSNFFNYRVAVKSEKLARTDHGRRKNERVEFMSALGGLVSSFAPVLQQSPALAPFIFESVKWVMSSFEGSKDIQGVLDQAITATMQQMQQQQMNGPPPDPKLQAAQMKAQTDMQKAQMDAQAKQQQTQLEAQARLQEISAESAAEVEKQKAQTIYDTLAEAQKARIKLEADMAANAHKAKLDLLKPKPVVSYKPKPNGGAPPQR